jgi:hypothetical protein
MCCGAVLYSICNECIYRTLHLLLPGTTSGPRLRLNLKSRRALTAGMLGGRAGREVVRHTASALEPDSFRSVTRIPDDVPDLTSRFGRTKALEPSSGPAARAAGREAMSPRPPLAARARSEASALETALR